MADSYDISEIRERMDSSLGALQKDLGGLRTGRATPSLVDTLMVDAYGSQSPMNQVANIGAPESKLLMIQVWDKSLISAVEKTIRDANLGLNPVVDGQNIRIPLPDLNEERRKELVKIAKDYGETAKVAVRHIRRDGMELLKSLEKSKDMGKDDAYKEGEGLQKLTDEKIASIDALLSSKEEEIMQI